jgi:hypothetical protein
MDANDANKVGFPMFFIPPSSPEIVHPVPRDPRRHPDVRCVLVDRDVFVPVEPALGAPAEVRHPLGLDDAEDAVVGRLRGRHDDRDGLAQHQLVPVVRVQVQRRAEQALPGVRVDPPEHQQVVLCQERGDSFFFFSSHPKMHPSIQGRWF